MTAQRKNQFAAASAIAEVARCPRKVALAAKYGERRTARVERDRLAGIAQHARFEDRSRYFHANPPRPAATTGRCFVATALLGADSPDTMTLRRFRDRRLRSSWLGRRFVAWYYRNSPSWIRATSSMPRLRLIMAGAISMLACIASIDERRHARAQSRRGLGRSKAE